MDVDGVTGSSSSSSAATLIAAITSAESASTPLNEEDQNGPIELENLNDELCEDAKSYCSSGYWSWYRAMYFEEFYDEEGDHQVYESAGPSTSTSNKRRGSEKLWRRINGTNGTVIRGVDLRHMPRWIDQLSYFVRKFANSPNYIDTKGQWKREPKALVFNKDEREHLVSSGPFGMNAYSIQYSLGKHKRWELNEYFEENPKEFQYPLYNISTVLLESDQMPEPSQLINCDLPPLINGICLTQHRVRRMIAPDFSGQLYNKESKTGRALPVDILKPVQPLPKPSRKQPKHKKAARRFRRREMLRKRDECQEAPIRLTYFVNQPRPTLKQLEAEAPRQKFTSFLHGKKCPKQQKQRSLIILPEDYFFPNHDFKDAYQNHMIGLGIELDEDCHDPNGEEYTPVVPRGFSLADFIVDEDYASSFVHYSELSTPLDERYEFVERRDSTGNSSVNSFELVDEF